MAIEASTIIADWPDASHEAAELVVDAYGEPHEATGSMLVWYGVGPWKRVIATREYEDHHFPIPHIDAVTSVIDYRVPPEVVSELAAYDGSVVVARTAGEVSARCHDEQANFLALNLVHDIVTGAKDAASARDYYATEFLNVRRGQPTPYMDKLQFSPHQDAADPDDRVLSDEDLEQAAEQGEQ